MSKPFVSVFIPVYNSEKYIGEAIESILNQTYRNFELIIVDDGSTDNTIQVINKYTDNRIRVVQNKKNMGIPYTRNIGLNEARGKYLVLMDADDISYPTRIETQVNYMENNPNIVAAGTAYKHIGNTKKKRVINKKGMSSNLTKIKLLFGSPLANATSIIRLSIVREKNLKYDEEFFVAQDYKFWVELSKYGELAVIPKLLYKYRIGHMNITKKSRELYSKERKKLVEKIQNEALENNKFILNPDKLKTFHDFFTDSPRSAERSIDKTSIYELLYELININRKKKIFNDYDFVKILGQQTMIAISNLDINLKSQIKLFIKSYKIINKKIEFKSVLYLIGKKLYSKFFH